MLTAYIKAAMRRAKYEILPDDKSFYAEIPSLEGVYACYYEWCNGGRLP